MSRVIVSLTLSSVLLALCVSVEAQQGRKMARIGYLSANSGPPLSKSNHPQSRIQN